MLNELAVLELMIVLDTSLGVKFDGNIHALLCLQKKSPGNSFGLEPGLLQGLLGTSGTPTRRYFRYIDRQDLFEVREG